MDFRVEKVYYSPPKSTQHLGWARVEACISGKGRQDFFLATQLSLQLPNSLDELKLRAKLSWKGRQDFFG